MATIDNIMYQSYGLDSKPVSNMNSCFNIPIEQIDTELLKHNLDMFKKINSL